jgi:hypothetical protein
MKTHGDKADIYNKFSIKRGGADLDDIFWSYGKVHGIENIAYCDPVDVDNCDGNPVAL